jgi:solute carrier family 25 protein 42
MQLAPLRYGGITPTLIGIIPYAGISFATFETLKGTYLSRQKRAAEVGLCKLIHSG